MSMRIAFVGKGGSGKTTMSALFSLYMDSRHHKTVGLVDVDVNSHTAEVLGVAPQNIQYLSATDAQTDIMTYLAGSNQLVDASEMLNTTPPGKGSGRYSPKRDNYITAHYANVFGRQSSIVTLGSYSGASIGADCHHTTQHVAENILTHAQLADDEILVVDSVAGNDTFANSLYLQDVLLFIVRPERESMSVYHRYCQLAADAGVNDRVYAIGNNAHTDMQRAFIERHIPVDRLLGIVSTSDTITERRLEDLPLDVSCIDTSSASLFDIVFDKIREHQRTPAEYYHEITLLHQKVASQSWVAGAYRKGLTDQIDPEYEAL